MAHFGGTADGRSASEIMAEARSLQARHAPRVFRAALRRVQDTCTRMTGGRGPSEDRGLLVG